MNYKRTSYRAKLEGHVSKLSAPHQITQIELVKLHKATPFILR